MRALRGGEVTPVRPLPTGELAVVRWILGDDAPVDVPLRMPAFDVLSEGLARLEVPASEGTPVVVLLDYGNHDGLADDDPSRRPDRRNVARAYSWSLVRERRGSAGDDRDGHARSIARPLERGPDLFPRHP